MDLFHFFVLTFVDLFHLKGVLLHYIFVVLLFAKNICGAEKQDGFPSQRYVAPLWRCCLCKEAKHREAVYKAFAAHFADVCKNSRLQKVQLSLPFGALSL